MKLEFHFSLIKLFPISDPRLNPFPSFLQIFEPNTMTSSSSNASNPICVRCSYTRDGSFSAMTIEPCCRCDAVDGKPENPSLSAVARQRSFFRPLTLDEQIETLVVHFEGLIDQVKKDVDLGNVNRRKSMKVG